MIFFIIGASGVGKSTVLPLLKEAEKDIVFYDFDDIGVPENADKIWRQQSTNAWLEKLSKENKNTCILGGAVPGEIISTPFYIKNRPEIRVCLIDCADEVRYERLIKRASYGPNQDIMNWGCWLRLHVENPNWEPHVIVDNAWGGMDFSSLEKQSGWFNFGAIERFDNSYESPHDTATCLLDWIHSKLDSSNETIKQYTNLPKSLETKMTEQLVKYEASHDVDVNYHKAHLVLEDKQSGPKAILSYYTCFSEVYIDDIWVSSDARGQGLGKKLISALEAKFSGKGFNNVNCVTSDFQAPEFYKKCGFKLEFKRANEKNPKLTKYFFVKFFNEDIEKQGVISIKGQND